VSSSPAADTDPNRARFLIAASATTGDRAEFDRELQRIEPLLPARAPLRVLDAGCGSAPWSMRWIERGAHVTSIDFDADVLKLALQRPELDRARFRAVAADVARLPLRDGAFDVVVLNSILEHVPAWDCVVAEGARVLAPGGVMVLHTTNRWHPLQRELNGFPFYPWLPDALKRRVLAWIMAHRRDLVNYTDYPAIHWFSYEPLKATLRSHGLEPHDRLDLPRPAVTELQRFVLFLLGNGRGGPRLRNFYYVIAKAVSLYAKKAERADPDRRT
jgi:SAM-dependent methyltransferase